MDDSTAVQVREIMTKGAAGFCIGLTTDIAARPMMTLLERGAEVMQEPTERFYGTDCGLRDPFGNAIRILEPAPAGAGALGA